MGTTEILARFVANTTFDTLPEAAVKVAKRQILDTVGVALLAHEEPTARIALNFLREVAARPRARVIGYGFKTSIPDVAFADGILAHALDFDDVGGCDHTSCVLVPTILAAGEPHDISGRDFIEAYILAWEVGAKLFSAYPRGSVLTGTGSSMHDVGFHTNGIFGTIAACAAAAKIFRLNVEQTRMAFGIAAAQAAGIYQNVGSMANPLTAGNAARCGVVSAMLAKEGFTGDATIMEAEYGFLRAFSCGAAYDLNNVIQSLGNPYDIVSPGPGIKLYPACSGTHAGIAGVLQLIKEGHIIPGQVAEIESIELDCQARMMTAHPTARTGLEGKFHNPFTVAMALLDGEVNQAQFNEGRVLDPRTQELMKKVKHVPRKSKSDPLVVSIKMRDGRVFSATVTKRPGYVGNPPPDDVVYQKYLHCASKVLSASAAESSLKLLQNLDKVKNIKELIDTITLPGIEK